MKFRYILFIFIIGGAIFFLGEYEEDQTVYNYIEASSLKDKMENSEELIIVDVQEEEEWNDGHIINSISTYSTSLKRLDDSSNLEKIIKKLEDFEHPIIIVSRNGKDDAEQAFRTFKENYFDMDRVFILKEGQEAWPYEELLE